MNEKKKIGVSFLFYTSKKNNISNCFYFRRTCKFHAKKYTYSEKSVDMFSASSIYVLRKVFNGQKSKKAFIRQSPMTISINQSVNFSIQFVTIGPNHLHLRKLKLHERESNGSIGPAVTHTPKR